MRLFTHLLPRPPVSANENHVALVPDSTPPSMGSASTFADVAQRIGDDNEMVRNLLKEIDVQFGAVDTLKLTFDKVVEPLHKLADALNRETVDNAGLRGALAELRVSHGALRAKQQALETKWSGLQAENRQLTNEAGLLKRANQTLDGDKAALTAEVATLCSSLTVVEKQLQQSAEDAHLLEETKLVLLDRLETFKKRAIELEVAMTVERERASLLESEKLSLQGSLDRALSRASQMSVKVNDLEKSLFERDQKLEDLLNRSKKMEDECHRLAAACDEANQTRDAAIEALTSQLDAAMSRSMAAELQCKELHQTLELQATRMESLETKLVGTDTVRGAAENEAASLRVSLEENESQIEALKVERSALVVRCEDLNDAAASREKLLGDAENNIKLLRSRIETIEKEAGETHTSSERQLEQLKGEIEGLRIERAVDRGALERARADFARTQRDLARLQQSPRGDADNSQSESDDFIVDER